MCGRYAATANPDELVLEFEVDEDRTGEPGRSVLVEPAGPTARPARPQHGADQAGAGRALAGAPRRPRRRAAPPAAAAHLGPGPQLVQGPQRRRPDDQRPGRVGRRQAGLRPGARLAALPGAGTRVVRVAGVTDRARRQGQAAQAAVLHLAGRRRQRRDGRPLRVLARPGDQRRRRPARLADHVHGGHRTRRAGPRPHPRPPAARARAARSGRPGSTRTPGPPTCSGLLEPTGPGPIHGVPRLAGGEQQPVERPAAARTAAGRGAASGSSTR